MRRFLVLTVGLGLLFAFSAAGQTYGPYRGQPYYDGRNYEQGYRGGYGDIVGRAMADLTRAGSYNRREWKHFDHAQRELGKFQDKWARGHFDTHPLDEAIDELKHLAYSGHLSPRDSSMLARDIEPLREFRATRGYSGGYRGGVYNGYRDEPYGYGR